MHPRVLAVLIPVALLVTACSAAVSSPPVFVATSAAPSPAVTASAEAPSAAPSVAPSVAPSIVPSAAPSAEVLTGEVPVTMTDDMRFDPAPITVRAGEPITFLVRNDGVVVHEFFVGTEDAQAEHAVEMAAGGMGHGHDNAVSVEPGAIESLTMTFAEAGSLLIGCHEPGHYLAGMKAVLAVAD